MFLFIQTFKDGQQADIFKMNFPYRWTKDLLNKSMSKKHLTLDDVREINEADKSGYLGDGLEKYFKIIHINIFYSKTGNANVYYFYSSQWNKEIFPVQEGKKRPNPSLAKALVRQFFWQNVLLGFMNFLDVAVLEICQPIFMGWVISYFTAAGKKIDQNTVIGYAGLFILSKLISTFVDESYERYSMIVGMRARIACCSLLYRKVYMYITIFISIT